MSIAKSSCQLRCRYELLRVDAPSQKNCVAVFRYDNKKDKVQIFRFGLCLFFVVAIIIAPLFIEKSF